MDYTHWKGYFGFCSDEGDKLEEKLEAEKK